MVYNNQGRYDEAEPLLKRALGILEKALGPEDPDFAGSLNNLAMVYYAQGRYDSSVVSGDLSINRDNVGRVLHLPVPSVSKIGNLLEHCLVGVIANAYGVNLDPRGILL